MYAEELAANTVGWEGGAVHRSSPGSEQAPPSTGATSSQESLTRGPGAVLVSLSRSLLSRGLLKTDIPFR
jgi:hypothetical protein